MSLPLPKPILDLSLDLQPRSDVLFGKGAVEFVEHVHSRFRLLPGTTSADAVVRIRCMRSLWAKQSLDLLADQATKRIVDRRQFEQFLATVAGLRTRVPATMANSFAAMQDRLGDSATSRQLAMLLADQGDHSISADLIHRLDPSAAALLRRGPAYCKGIRPSRGSSRSNPSNWLNKPAMGQVEFVDGNPDHIIVRGVSLRSGDIGIVELNHPGDGIFDSFLKTPGLAPHAMLYVSQRVRLVGGETLIQPSLFEIYEGGWRLVPVTTGLNPRFSWYSHWMRPPGLPDDIGHRLSEQIDALEQVAFDFQSRRIPAGGQFTVDWGRPSASCTNLIRIPFERVGIELPYPTTEVDPGASENLDRLGLPGIGPIHTPTNMLNDSGFESIGFVDNGFAELAYAQAMVVGRPELPHTFGGRFCTQELNLKNLPDWKSINRWRSAQTAFLIRLGQSDSMIAFLSRQFAGYSAEEIPRTASPTTIAFYLRSDMEAGHLMQTRVVAELRKWFASDGSIDLQQLHREPMFVDLISAGIDQSALGREGWYS